LAAPADGGGRIGDFTCRWRFGWWGAQGHFFWHQRCRFYWRGAGPSPWELSLGHTVVLFLDELPEVQRNVSGVMMQPLEDGAVTISRRHPLGDVSRRVSCLAGGDECLVRAGYFRRTPRRECHCTPPMSALRTVRNTRAAADRIDIHIEFPP